MTDVSCPAKEWTKVLTNVSNRQVIVTERPTGRSSVNITSVATGGAAPTGEVRTNSKSLFSNDDITINESNVDIYVMSDYKTMIVLV